MSEVLGFDQVRAGFVEAGLRCASAGVVDVELLERAGQTVAELVEGLREQVPDAGQLGSGLMVGDGGVSSDR